MVPFRWIDTGLRGGRENIAFDQALISLHAAGRIRDTLRFLQFRPCVLAGRHQVLEEAVDLAACREAGVEVGRRVTGGGALYLDEGQFGWELVFARSRLPFADLSAAARAICEAACLGLARLGIAARFRPRNDIEVDGRKLGGTGGFFEGRSLFYQGTMLVRFDPTQMVRLLRVPAAELARHGAATAAQRIVTLAEPAGNAPPLAEVKAVLAQGLAEGLGLTLELEAVSAQEAAAAARLFAEEIGTDAFVGLDGVRQGARSHGRNGGIAMPSPSRWRIVFCLPSVVLRHRRPVFLHMIPEQPGRAGGRAHHGDSDVHCLPERFA